MVSRKSAETVYEGCGAFSRAPEEKLLCALLRGERAAWPADADEDFANGVLARARYHGVEALLQHRLRQGAGENWPALVAEHLRGRRRRAVAGEMFEREALAQMLRTLVDGGVRPVLMKGVPLAYSLYPFPAARPHSDTDFLVPRALIAKTRELLAGLGYVCSPVRGELASYQTACNKTFPNGYLHALEPHWRINHRQLFARCFDYRAALAESIELPRLGEHARGLGAVHALLLACMHRASHLQNINGLGGDRLIWLYDIHLLFERMDDDERIRFAGVAADRQVAAVCLDGLLHARRCFGTPPAPAAERVLAGAGDTELSRGYLTASHAYAIWTDFRALDWPSRLRLLVEYAVPPREYLRWRYDGTGRTWLPLLYLKHGAFNARRFGRTLRYLKGAP